MLDEKYAIGIFLYILVATVAEMLLRVIPKKCNHENNSTPVLYSHIQII